MPRSNQPRTIAGEHAVSRRVAALREEHELSYRTLADDMAGVGCPIDSSALHRIEKGERRITVDELVAFGLVFGVPVDEMVLPPEVAASKEAIELWDEYQAKGEQFRRLRGELVASEQRLMEILDSRSSAAVQEALRSRFGHDAEPLLIEHGKQRLGKGLRKAAQQNG